MSKNKNKENKVMQETEKQEVVDISIDKIPVLTISYFKTEEIEALAQELQQTREIEPLTVICVKDNEDYEILSGEKTYRAVRLVNEREPELFATVPCRVKKQIAETVDDVAVTDDDIQTVLDQIDDAEKKKDGYRLRIYTHIIRICGDTYKDRHMKAKLAEAFGISIRYSGMYEGIVKRGSEDLKQAVIEDKKKGHITASLASQIMTLPKNKQKNIIERVQNGENASKAYRSETEERQLLRGAKATKSWIELLLKNEKNLSKDQKNTLQFMRVIVDDICENRLKKTKRTAGGVTPDKASGSDQKMQLTLEMMKKE